MSSPKAQARQHDLDGAVEIDLEPVAAERRALRRRGAPVTLDGHTRTTDEFQSIVDRQTGDWPGSTRSSTPPA